MQSKWQSLPKLEMRWAWIEMERFIGTLKEKEKKNGMP